MEASGGIERGDGDNLDDLQKRWEHIKREIGTEIEGEAEAAIWWGAHVAAWEDAVEQREKEVEERALRLAEVEQARRKASLRLRQDFHQQERLLLREKALEEEKVLLLREKVVSLEEKMASRTQASLISSPIPTPTPEVKLGLSVLTRLGENFDEKALHSIVHETLKAVVAQYSADEMITQRESPGTEIRNKLAEGKEEEKELTHGCFGSGFFPWKYGRRTRRDPGNEACSSLKERLLAPQHSKPMPTPPSTPNPVIADAKAITVMTSRPKAKVYQFEAHIIGPRFERPTTDQSTTVRKDPQMVKSSLCVHTRLGENFDEKALHSIVHATLKAVVAQFSANEIITHRESLSTEIKNKLIERARNFEVLLDDVSITSLCLLTAAEEADHAKFISYNKIEDNNSEITEVQVPRSKRSTARDVYACPYLVESTSKSKDLQMVKIGLCVLTKLGKNFDDNALLSIIHETLETVVAQYNASQIFRERESQIMSMEIRNKLTEKAINFDVVLDDVFITSLGLLNAAGHGHTKFSDRKIGKDNMIAIVRETGDETWTKRLNGYVFFLGAALTIMIIVRPLLPLGHDRWMLAVFATLWGLGSIGIPLGMFGTTRLEKEISRHVGRFLSLCFSLMVIYGTYLLAKPSEPHTDVEVAWTITFAIIGFLVSVGHIISWVMGCCCGGDKDAEPS